MGVKARKKPTNKLGEEVIDDLPLLLDVLPSHLRETLEKEPDLEDLVEVVEDLGRQPEARFFDRVVYLDDLEVTRQDLDYVTSRIGAFTGDNRAGIERTLHRDQCHPESTPGDYRTDLSSGPCGHGDGGYHTRCDRDGREPAAFGTARRWQDDTASRGSPRFGG